MAKKKIKKKKKKAKKKGGGKGKVLGDLDAQVLVPEHVPKYCTIHCKLINWVFLDFTLRNVNIESTRLFSIKRKIKQRHGRISNLRIYLGTMQPQTELKDEMMTLEELGIEGLPLVRPSSPASAVAAASKQTGRGDGISDDDGISPGVQGVKNITLWYDFKPFAHEDPLLLR